MFGNFKVRCSAISMATAESRSSQLLTEKQVERMKELDGKENITDKQKDELAGLQLKAKNSAIVVLSDSYIGYLMEEYAYRTEGMVGVLNDFEGLQMINGTLVEADSLIALIEAEGKPYKPNINEKGEQGAISNEFLTGHIDAYLGEQMMGADEIPDIKSSFDYPTFLKKINVAVTKPNRQQLQGYGLISGTKVLFIADCLSNTCQEAKDGLKWKLMKKLEGQIVSEESELFQKHWAIIERSTNFSHLSAKLRTNKRYIEPMSDIERDFLYDQVKRGRDFLNNLYEARLKLN